MATLNVALSGGWRVSSTSDVITKTFAPTITCSVFFQQEIVVLPNVSDFIVSFSLFSAPSLIMATATNVVRINFAGMTSSVSAASAGVIQFKDAMFIMASGGNLPSAVHLANSGADSAVVTLLIGQ